MLLHALLAFTSLVSSVPLNNDARVLILGGGAAGLSAAKTLSDQNITDFIIVEGSSRLGGRVKSVHFSGKTVEVGANWIVGKEGNPMYHTSLKVGLNGLWSDFDDVVIRDSSGNDVTEREGENAWSKLEEADTNIEGLASRLEDLNDDMSMRACLDIGGWRPRSPVEKVVEIYEYDFEYAGPPDVGSCSSMLRNKAMIDDVFYVSDSRGYEFLLKSYVEDEVNEEDQRVRLNEVVTNVERTGGKVKVETESGNLYTADYAIITFSIGVLKSQSVNFEPQLPAWKLDNLYRVRFENYFGIYLKFGTPRFWDDSAFILHADERRGYFPVWMNLEADGLAPPGTNILEVVTFGEEAERVSRLTTDQIKAEVMTMLRRVYRKSDIPEPEEILVPNWRNDPLYLGSFPQLEPGADLPEVSEAIQAPVGRLYFAGDAFDKDMVGYVFGALRSGETAALEIADLLAG